MMRERLPDRRGHQLIDFKHGGLRYSAGIGRFGDGRPAELFLNAAKIGTASDVHARDGAILLSLLLQHGCPIETIQRAVLSNPDGSAASPLGKVVDLLSRDGC